MRASVGVRSNPKARPYSVTSSTSGRLSMDVVLRFRYQSSPGTGSSCEPDEARGSPRREAYSLYVERRGRPSNEVWRRKLPQYLLSGWLDIVPVDHVRPAHAERDDRGQRAVQVLD